MTKLESSETFATPSATDLLNTRRSSDNNPLSPTLGGMDKENLSFFVESLKQKRTLRALASSLKEEVPLIYEALIGERYAVYVICYTL